jgi:hypothetical protein
MSGGFALEMRLHEVIDGLEACEESVKCLQALSTTGAAKAASSVFTDPLASTAEGGASSAERRLDEIVSRLQTMSRALYTLHKHQATAATAAEPSEQFLGAKGTQERRPTQEYKSNSPLTEVGAGGGDTLSAGSSFGAHVDGSFDVVIPVIDTPPRLESTMSSCSETAVDALESGIRGSGGGTNGATAVSPSSLAERRSLGIVSRQTFNEAAAAVGSGNDLKQSSQLAKSTNDSTLSSPRSGLGLAAYARGSTGTSLTESVWFSPAVAEKSLTSKATMTPATILASTPQQTEEGVAFTGTPSHLRNMNEDCELYIAALERRWSVQEREKLRDSTVV